MNKESVLCIFEGDILNLDNILCLENQGIFLISKYIYIQIHINLSVHL